MRYIDADALKSRMFNYYECVNENTSKSGYKGEPLMNYEVADMIEDCIDNAPTADVVEVRHGEWLVDAWDGKKFITMPYEKHQHIDPFCSICRKEALLDGVELGVASNYCPYCGAKMDGGRSAR